MKNKLEERMTDALDTASLNDLMPGFDKEGLWDAIAPQLQEPQKKQRLFPLGFKWISYAAAVLLAAITTYGVMHFTAKMTQPSIIVKVNTPLPAQALPEKSAAPLKQQTPALMPMESIAQTTAPSPTIPAKTISHSPETIKGLSEEKTIAQQQITAPIIPILQRTETLAKASPRKVTHYLDVDDAPDELPAQNIAGPSFIQVKLNKPGVAEDVNQRAPLKEFVFALGK